MQLHLYILIKFIKNNLFNMTFKFYRALLIIMQQLLPIKLPHLYGYWLIKCLKTQIISLQIHY